MSSVMEHDPSNMKTYNIWFGIGQMAQCPDQHINYINMLIKDFREDSYNISAHFWTSFKKHIAEKYQDHCLGKIDLNDWSIVRPQSLELYEQYDEFYCSPNRPVFCLKLLYNESTVGLLTQELDAPCFWLYNFEPFGSVDIDDNQELPVEQSAHDTSVWKNKIYMSILLPEIVSVDVDEGLDQDGVPIYVHDQSIAHIRLIVESGLVRVPPVFFTCKRYPTVSFVWRNKPSKSAVKSKVMTM